MYRRRIERRLCAICKKLSGVRSGGDGDTVQLACGHCRTSGLLPSKGVGLEEVLDNTEEAARLFPSLVPGIVVKGKPKKQPSVAMPKAA
jgi:hypothetical protein